MNIAFVIGLVVFIGCFDDSMQAFWGTKTPKNIQENKPAFHYENKLKFHTPEQKIQPKEEPKAHLQPLNNVNIYKLFRNI